MVVMIDAKAYADIDILLFTFAASTLLLRFPCKAQCRLAYAIASMFSQWLFSKGMLPFCHFTDWRHAYAIAIIIAVPSFLRQGHLWACWSRPENEPAVSYALYFLATLADHGLHQSTHNDYGKIPGRGEGGFLAMFRAAHDKYPSIWLE